MSRADRTPCFCRRTAFRAIFAAVLALASFALPGPAVAGDEPTQADAAHPDFTCIAEQAATIRKHAARPEAVSACVADHVLLSEAVVRTAPNTPYPVINGWRAATAYRDQETGFRAVVFESGARAIVVFAGSDVRRTGEVDTADVLTDIWNLLGVPTRQNQQARQVVRKEADRHADISCTGHSLGGELCQYAASWEDVPAVAVNSAPLSMAPGPHTSAIIVTGNRGDPVSQGLPGLLRGQKHAGVEYYFDSNCGAPLDCHLAATARIAVLAAKPTTRRD